MFPPGIPFAVSNLDDTYASCILICMRTTLIIRDEVLSKAASLTGVTEKTALVHMGLEALIAKASAARLAQLGGTEKKATAIPRRRTP
jgi:Arc/MetJ family transcription regulator